MVVRSLCFGAALGGVALLPAACGAFTDDTPNPGVQGAEAGDAGPGAEGSATIDGAPDEGSAPPQVVMLAKGSALLWGVVATETDVFYIDQGTGGVYDVPILGGSARMLAMGQAPHSVAFAGGAVYWADANTYTIGRVEVATGAIKKTPATTAQDHVSVLAITDNRLFGLVYGSGGSDGQVVQFGLDLTAVTSDTITGRTNPFDLTAYGKTAYWTEGSPANQITSAVEETAVTGPSSAEHDCQSIVADQAGMYWARPSDQLVRARLNGGAPITIASNEAKPFAIAADGTSVYWTTENNELRRSGHQENGGSSLFARDFTRIADAHVHAIAVTNKYVVWLTSDGKVLRANK